MTTYYRNEYLFSEIYLQEITQQPEDTEILASLTTLKEYREWARTTTIQEWKDSFVHEVLYSLGFGIKSENEKLTLLYPVGHKETPLTLCYVLLPTEDLDNTTMGRNWAEKVIRSLRHHNLKWGLLTNGEQWRIYHLDESTPYEIFLEMNLAAILSDNALQAYQIFHKFMKVENFTTDEQGQCRLDMFKKESLAKIDYIESELANALKQKEEGGKGVLSNLCMGYVEFLKASSAPNLDDDALRRKIYHGAMLYMFRLLFLFYADARDLLNETNSRLLEDVLKRCKPTSANDTSASNNSIWEDLESIFVDIDQSYNGGLFDPHESEFTQFIEESRVNDAYLASAVHYLTSYQERSKEEKAISYRDMNVRHLGTLYEGLLEHKLFIAKEDTEVQATKDKIQFIPASQGGRIVAGHYITAGQVYFGSDRSERKATGSFYTPEYIVDYIVCNTVGEKLLQLRQDFLAEQKDLLRAVGKAIDQKERKALTELLEDNLRIFIKEKVLKLSVLDPAMGSGHFLVNTSNYIANFITEILNELEIIGTAETSTTYWRRWVVENCVYGVDVNSLAVELAKLSLWVLSMSKEKPLSFLIHNLKTGNSLIGAHLDDIGKYPGKEHDKQLSVFSGDQDFKEAVDRALSNYARITSTDTASLDAIADKKAWLDEIDDILKPYKLVCDMHTSLYFGNEISEWEYKELIYSKDVALSNNAIPSFFHWELEFPDILIDNKGFNIVIGNPPWGQKAVKFTNEDKIYFKKKYPSAIHGILDIFRFFIERSIAITKLNGSFANVLPDIVLLKNYDSTRKFILENLTLTRIDHWGMAFKNVNLDSCTVIGIKRSYKQNHIINAIIHDKNRTIYNKIPQIQFIKLNGYKFNLHLTHDTIAIIEKLDSCDTFGNFYDPHEGIHSGNIRKKLFIDKKIDQYSQKLIFGRDEIRKYYIKWNGKWVNYNKSIIYKKDGEYAGLGKPEYFENDKLVVRRTGDFILAAVDYDKFYFTNNVFVCLPKEDSPIDIKYALANLNSRLSTWYYRAIQPRKGKLFAELKINILKKLPLKFAKESDQKPFIHIVNRIISMKKFDKHSDTIAFENEIDQMVYELYGLTKEEIAIIEGDKA